MASWNTIPESFVDLYNPLQFEVVKFIEYDGKNQHALVLLRDDQSKERVSIIRGKMARLLSSAAILARYPLPINIFSSELISAGDSEILEVFLAALDPHLLLPANAINLQTTCPHHTYLNKFVNVHEFPNRILLEGTILHDFLSFLYHEIPPKVVKLVDRQLYVKFIKPALEKALHFSWNLLVAFRISERDYLDEFRTEMAKKEIRFLKEHLSHLLRENNGPHFHITAEIPLQSLKHGLIGRLDRLIQVDGKVPSAKIIETKLGKGSTSSIQGALTQLYAYDLMLTASTGVDVTDLLIEYPMREVERRLESFEVEEKGLFDVIRNRNTLYGILWGQRPYGGPFEFIGLCANCWHYDACSFYCYLTFGNQYCIACKNPCDYPKLLDHPRNKAVASRGKIYYQYFFQLLSQEAFDELDLRRELVLPAETRERLGNCIGNLKLQEIHELGERFQYRLLRPQNMPISGTRLREGDLVALARHDKPGTTGTTNLCTIDLISDFELVISARKQIQSATDVVASPKVRFRVDMVSFSVVTDREKSTLDFFYRFSFSKSYPHLTRLRDLVLFLVEPQTGRKNMSLAKPFSFAFDLVQTRAIQEAVTSQEIFLIQGPPGTGKTTVICELIFQILQEKKLDSDIQDSRISFGSSTAVTFKKPKKVPILVTAFTHRAVDNIVRKLVENYRGIKVLRVGALASVQDPVVREYCLEKLAEDVVPGEKAEKRSVSAENARLLLDSADVIASTTTNLASTLFLPYRFGTVILDEAGQISEPSTLIPLTRADRAILVGDHQQLPSISKGYQIPSDRYEMWRNDLDSLEILPQDTLSTSFLERFARRYEDTPHMIVLEYQYRMNKVINDFASEVFYKGKLKPGLVNGSSVGEGTLLDFLEPLGIHSFPVNSYYGQFLDPAFPLTFIDTTSAGMLDSKSEEGVELESKYNMGEVSILSEILVEFYKCLGDLSPEELRGQILPEVGVIAAYRAQVLALKRALEKALVELYGDLVLQNLWDLLLVDTVDRFQGKEREFVLISLVDSNAENTISSIVADSRRLNVSVTRAKKKVIIVGNAKTLTNPAKSDGPVEQGAKQVFSALIRHAKKAGGYFEFNPQKTGREFSHS